MKAGIVRGSAEEAWGEKKSGPSGRRGARPRNPVLTAASVEVPGRNPCPPPLLRVWGAEVSRLHAAPSLALLLDYDGTLVPIRPRPEEAQPDEGLRSLLKDLLRCRKLRTAVVSGRTMKELLAFFPLEELYLVGNHGMEIRRGSRLLHHHPVGPAGRNILEQAKRWSADRVDPAAGFFVEDKGTSLALHYRNAPPGQAARVIEEFRRLHRQVDPAGTCQMLAGKKVVELRPLGWDKGSAVQWLLSNPFRSASVAVYAGDDVTDEDAFAAVRDGITLLVARQARPSAARFRVASPAALHRLLRDLVRIRTGRR